MGPLEQAALGQIVQVTADGVRRDRELARTLHHGDRTALFCDLEQLTAALCRYCIIWQNTLRRCNILFRIHIHAVPNFPPEAIFHYNISFDARVTMHFYIDI